LAFDYVADLAGLLPQFSVRLSPADTWSSQSSIRSLWRRLTPAGQSVRITARPGGSTGPRTTDWLAKGVVKQHRAIGTTLSLLIGAGLTIFHVEELSSTDERIKANPEWAKERQRPTFLLVGARRKSAILLNGSA
jgi:hypothetical protein